MEEKITNIPKIKVLKDLQPEQLDKISIACGGLPLEAQVSYTPAALAELRNRFFSGRPISNQEMQIVKRSFLRGTTQLVAHFTTGLLHFVRNDISFLCYLRKFTYPVNTYWQ